jgi:RNA polymerase primary sigma factor
MVATVKLYNRRRTRIVGHPTVCSDNIHALYRMERRQDVNFVRCACIVMVMGIMVRQSCDAFLLQLQPLQPIPSTTKSSRTPETLSSFGHHQPAYTSAPSKQGKSKESVTAPNDARPNSTRRSTASVSSQLNDMNESFTVPKKAKRRKEISKQDYQLEVSMMNHELLNKEEEYELSHLYQTAKQLQIKIDTLLQDKKLQQEFMQSKNDLQSYLQATEGKHGDFMHQLDINDDEFDDSLDDDDEIEDMYTSSLLDGKNPGRSRSKVYTDYTEWQQLDTNYKSIQAKSELLELLDQSSRTTMATLLLNDNEDDIMDPLSIVASQWRDSVQPKDIETSRYSSSATLTEEDIIQALQIPGGRMEMESILLKGAHARDTLIRSNLKLVSSICKRWSRISSSKGNDSSSASDSLYSIYSGSWDRPSLSEAVQEGVIGLTTAVERFDPSRGLRFSTYATYWITNSVRQCFQRSSTGCLRLPINYYDTRTRFKTLVRQYYEMDGSVPSMDVLARELGLPERRLQLILGLTQPLLSMDGLLRPKGSLTRAGKAGNVNRLEDNLLLADTIADSNSDHTAYSNNPMDRVELSFLRQQLEHAMAVELVPFERDVLRLRLGLDDGVMRTCREVAIECGGRLKTSEIRSTERRALKKLRSPVALATYKLLTYLDFADVDMKTITLQ